MSALTPYETILGLLAVREQHGYELLQTFQNADELGRIWKLSTSQLYALLKRMERDDLVQGRQVETADGPPRTEYELTPDGRAQMEAWLNNPSPSASIRRIRLEFLSRIYVAAALGRPTHAIWKHQIAACHAELDSLTAQRAQLEDGIQALAVELIMGQIQAAIQWLDGCKERGSSRLRTMQEHSHSS